MKTKSILLMSLFPLLFSVSCSRERTEPAAQKQEQKAAPPSGSAPGTNPALLDPNRKDEKAPATCTVKFETTKGDVLIKVTRSWAPIGADRFYNLVKIGYFDDTAVFRVLPGFMAQFGINGDPGVNKFWKNSQIPDDPVKESNRRGTLTFATAGPDTRTTQLFINFADNSRLDGQGFAPIGKVVQGMDVVDSIYSGYGEGAPQGKGPNQTFIEGGGSVYLKKYFPKLDYIKKATIME